jgi:hypothetical protein
MVYGSWIEGTKTHHKVSEIVASRRNASETYSAIRGTGFPRCCGRRQCEGHRCRRPSHSISALCPLGSVGSPTHLLRVVMPRHIDQEDTRHIRRSYHLGIGQGCNRCSSLRKPPRTLLDRPRGRTSLRSHWQCRCRWRIFLRGMSDTRPTGQFHTSLASRQGISHRMMHALLESRRCCTLRPCNPAYCNLNMSSLLW